MKDPLIESEVEEKFSSIRKEFPSLKCKTNNHALVYLDSAATSLKPQCVIDRISQFYSFEAANVHRGSHYLSDLSTRLYEESREKVAQFLDGALSEEIIFTRGTTESINLVATSWGKKFLQKGDKILLTAMEHHANIVPWQKIAEEKECEILVTNLTSEGTIDLEDFENKLQSGSKMVSFTACSNTFGTINPVKEMLFLAKKYGAITLVDAAQWICQKPVSLKEWNLADFVAFSGHKIFAPMGIGVLYGKQNLLESMDPYQYGGGMISQVSFEKTSFNNLPYKFEAGTPNVGGAVALKTAMDFIENIGWQSIHQWKKNLTKIALDELKKVPEIQILGPSEEKRSALISFNIKGLHPGDIAQILDQQGVAVRAGHLCTQPLLKTQKISGTLRASFSIYNNFEDVYQLKKSILKAQELLK